MFESLGEHAGFIVASYAFVAFILIAMIGLTLRDGAQQKKALADLEARGIRRRSDQAQPGASS
jgi:heme exporter protein D